MKIQLPGDRNGKLGQLVVEQTVECLNGLLTIPTNERAVVVEQLYYAHIAKAILTVLSVARDEWHKESREELTQTMALISQAFESGKAQAEGIPCDSCELPNGHAEPHNLGAQS
jgi:hypothetical protein